MLNNIVLNLDPDFTVNETKGSEDISRKTLWGNAARSMRIASKTKIPETRELASLHALRNLVQHSGTQPTQSETQRYLVAAHSMLTSVFKEVYELEFSNFKIWDLVPNDDLRVWLGDSEQVLKGGSPVMCIAACNHAHALIIGAIRNSTKLRRFRTSNVFSRAAVERFRNEIVEAIEFLEDEVVAIGVGLPLMDTRRFQKIGGLVLVFVSIDGHMQTRSKTHSQDRNELAKDAEFMLDYLSRLIRLLDEAYPGVLENIKIPLRLQESWGHENRAASPAS
jgi:hypothetical protein